MLETAELPFTEETLLVITTSETQEATTSVVQEATASKAQ